MASSLLPAFARRGLSVRRAVSLQPSPLRRPMTSVANPPPGSSNEKKIIAQLEEILATRSLPEDTVLDILTRAIDARCEAHMKELSRSFQTSVVLVAGGLFGYCISRV